MKTGSALFLALGVGLLCIVRYADAQYYSSYDLENNCNGTLTIDCPYTYSGRAGTFRYYYVTRLSPGFCNYNVTLDANCGRPLDYFAFYFNIRKFQLPFNDYLRIYDTSRYGQRTLLKELSGYQSASSDPASVAQALTAYNKRPSFSFEYYRSTSPASGSHEAFIDFVVTEDTSSNGNTYCSALSGYVNDAYICDKDGLTDRVNCPSSFTPSVTGRNAATWRQCRHTSPSTTPAYWYPTTEYWNSWNSNHDYGLSSGAITGIIMGCVFFVVFLVAVVSAACSASRRAAPSRPMVMTSSSAHVSSPHPVVVGNYAPTGPTPPFMGAPPSYAEVTAPTAQVSLTMPQPPPAPIPKY